MDDYNKLLKLDNIIFIYLLLKHQNLPKSFFTTVLSQMIKCDGLSNQSQEYVGSHWQVYFGARLTSKKCIFLSLFSGNFPAISDDLVNSYHLLLCCLDLIYSNASSAQHRRNLINPTFEGIESSVCINVCYREWSLSMRELVQM